MIHAILYAVMFLLGFALAKSFNNKPMQITTFEWHDASEVPPYNGYFGTQYLTEHSNGVHYSVLRYCDGWNCHKFVLTGETVRDNEIKDVTAWAVIPKR